MIPRVTRPALLLLSTSLLACGAPGELDRTGPEVADVPEPAPASTPTTVPPWEFDDVRSAVSLAGTYTVRWRPSGGVVPKNEPFELDVWVFRNGAEGEPPVPVPGAIVLVSGWMPDHGHGMIRSPRSTDNGDGSYRVAGMLLHMGGFWELFLDLIVDDVSERAQFELEL